MPAQELSAGDAAADRTGLRRLHSVAGWTAMVLFLASGVWMRLGHPGIPAPDAAHRLLFRSRHIYLLAASLIHLVLARYVQLSRIPWRRRVQRLASLLLCASVPLLVVAFLSEWRHDELRGAASSFGLYALFAGVTLHYLAGDQQGGRPRSPTPSS
jgi:hypothetical protein